MMETSWIHERLRQLADAPAFRADGVSVSFDALARSVDAAQRLLSQHEVPQGAVVVLHADFTPDALAMILALYLNRSVIVPLYDPHAERLTQVSELVNTRYVIAMSSARATSIERRASAVAHPLIVQLRAAGRPGLILISSGSTGTPKATLLDLGALFERYRPLSTRPLTVLTFLLFDHIGGFNTAFHTIFSGGTIVPAYSRAVDDVCTVIARDRVQILPTTPTFLNMLLVSRAHERHDLSSLELITYGTEVMPESTLRRLATTFPGVRLKQTYGMSEIGILTTKTDDPRSLWLRIGPNVQHKVVDGVLWLKSHTAMLGYLNAASPFDAEGWLCTGDMVEERDGRLRIIGRKENIINVGGLKVYPAEVESALLRIAGVNDALVWGKKSPVTGQIVAARLCVDTQVDQGDLSAFASHVKAQCREVLEDYKVPRHLSFTVEPIHNERFKKMSSKKLREARHDSQ